jgi:predicted transcriptional regulator
MARKVTENHISFQIPKKKMEKKIVPRLQRIAQKRDRSFSYIVIEALLQYLEQQKQ